MLPIIGWSTCGCSDVCLTFLFEMQHSNVHFLVSFNMKRQNQIRCDNPVSVSDFKLDGKGKNQKYTYMEGNKKTKRPLLLLYPFATYICCIHLVLSNSNKQHYAISWNCNYMYSCAWYINGMSKVVICRGQEWSLNLCWGQIVPSVYSNYNRLWACNRAIKGLCHNYSFILCKF